MASGPGPFGGTRGLWKASASVRQHGVHRSGGFGGSAAVRSGAGLVLLGVPEPVYTIEAVKLDEPVVFPPGGRGDGLSPGGYRRFCAVWRTVTLGLVGPAGPVARGPGGDGGGGAQWDADGLNVLEGAADALKARRAPTVLTPHDGEFRRLGGAVGPDRMASAAALAPDAGGGGPPEGSQDCGDRWNPGDMRIAPATPAATAAAAMYWQGSWFPSCQGLPPLEAAACAAWVHGAAGDLRRCLGGQYGLTPSRIWWRPCPCSSEMIPYHLHISTPGIEIYSVRGQAEAFPQRGKQGPGRNL